MQGKGRSFIFDGLNLDAALMQEQNLLAETEADATAVFPRTEKGNKDPVHQGWRNSATDVGYFDIDLTASGGRECLQLYPGIWLVFYRFNGVHQQVNQHLLDKCGIELIGKIRVLQYDFQLHFFLLKGRQHKLV